MKDAKLVRLQLAAVRRSASKSCPGCSYSTAGPVTADEVSVNLGDAVGFNVLN
jgi:hypothetical protein